jgi:heme exporter protein D
MTGLEKFLAMGGYAAYVWPALGATALALAVLAVSAWRAMRRAEAALAGAEDEARRARAEAGTRAAREAGR